MNYETAECDIELLKCDDDLAEALTCLFPGRLVPAMNLVLDEELVALCSVEDKAQALGAIDRDGKIRIWLKDSAIADSPVIENLQKALEYFNSTRSN